MKFRYKRYGSALRPVISVRVQYRGLSMLCEMLVDSGSDESLLDASIAKELGIELEKGELRKAVGVGGQTVSYFVHVIDLRIGDSVYATEVGFVERGPVDYGIAGQRGFFDKFVVSFDLLKEEVEFRPHGAGRI